MSRGSLAPWRFRNDSHTRKKAPVKKEKILDSINEEAVVQCQPQKPIWKVVADIGAQIPLATWEKVPDDASINFKHYLYGEPKRNA